MAFRQMDESELSSLSRSVISIADSLSCEDLLKIVDAILERDVSGLLNTWSYLFFHSAF